MDYDINAPKQEGFGQNFESQNEYQGDYVPAYKKPWLWIVIAAVFVCAAAVTILLVSGGTPQRYELTGNAGVVAAYDFYCTQQDSQDKLTGSVMKELGERLGKEPFEIESTIKMDLDNGEESFLPLSNVGIGIYAKYDMKDFGIRLGTMGMEVISGYLIDSNIVVSLMGKAGSMPVKLPEDVNISKNMGLKERIKAFLPFLPENEVYFTLLEKFAHSVPDKYTVTDIAQAYSPKDDKEVRMKVITTTLDSKAVKEIILSFADGIRNDKKLSRQLQDMIDGFTGFAGLESMSMEDIIKELEDSADSEAFKDIKISWSVYERHESYVGISIDVSAADTNVKYTYMCEFSGNDNFVSITSEMNGAKTEALYSYNWQGNKMKMDGEMNTIISEGTGNTTQLISGAFEFSKDGGNEYVVAGDIAINGDVYNDILNSSNSMSYDMKIDATINVGGGLGTLKEDRDWDNIYKEDWGKMEDIFGWLDPYGSLFDYDIGNNL